MKKLWYNKLKAQMNDKPKLVFLEPIKDCEGYYVSEEGEIYSYRSPNGRGPLAIEPRKLKPTLDSRGYYVVALRKNGKQYQGKVHRIIAETFIPNPKNLPTVDHINRIRHDNRLENLRWATRSLQSLNQKPVGKSQYKNVSFYASSKRWISKVYHNGKRVYLGSFESDLEAAKTYDAYVRKHNLPNVLNFP